MAPMTGWSGCGSRRAARRCDDDHAMASAYNAYRQIDRPGRARQRAFLIGRDYDRHDKHKEALAAFEAGSASPAPRGRRAGRAAEAARRFRVTKVEFEAEADAARACLRFNETDRDQGRLSYGAFVRTTPDLDGIVTGRGDTVCLDGLKHGETYQVELLAGLPAATGDKTLRDFKTNVVVPDRKPRSAFPAPAMCCRARAPPGCR